MFKVFTEQEQMKLQNLSYKLSAYITSDASPFAWPIVYFEGIGHRLDQLTWRLDALETEKKTMQVQIEGLKAPKKIIDRLDAIENEKKHFDPHDYIDS